jgi:hypothetical protein
MRYHEEKLHELEVEHTAIEELTKLVANRPTISSQFVDHVDVFLNAIRALYRKAPLPMRGS